MINKFRLRISVQFAVCACAVAISAAAHAGIFDAQTTDFALQFRVNGYGSDTTFSAPAALALDEKAGVIYVADTKAGEIDGFTMQGMPKLRYGAREGLIAPIGVAVDAQGTLYVTENEAAPIRVISAKGESSAFEIPKGDAKETPKPGRLVLDRDGNLYVVDRANERLCVFDAKKALKFCITGTDAKHGFKGLQDAMVDRQGRIYTLDKSGMPVQVFDKKGKLLYRFAYQGEGDQDISSPAGLFMDRNDQIWVVDRGQHALKVFDRSGSFLRRFGAYGTDEGLLFQPVDAEMDSFGRTYVVEAGARRLQVFSLTRPFEPFSPPGL